MENFRDVESSEFACNYAGVTGLANFELVGAMAESVSILLHYVRG